MILRKKDLKGKEAIEYIKKAKEPYSGKITEDLIYNGTKKDPKVIANYTEKLHAKQIGTSQLMVLDETAADYLISKYGLEEEDEQ